MSFIEQPAELIITQLESLPLEDVLKACESNSVINRVCNSKDFWFKRLARDFPQYNVRGNPDPRQAYIYLYMYGYYDDRIQSLISKFLGKSGRPHHNIRVEMEKYCITPTRGRCVLFSNLKDYIMRNNTDGQVIFPEYQLVGTPKDIVNYLMKYEHLANVDLGFMSWLTSRKKGSPPGNYPLTEQIVYDNSIDLHAPGGAELFEELKKEIEKEIKIVEAAVDREFSERKEFMRLGRIEGFSNGSNLQNRKQSILNRMIASVSPYYFSSAVPKAADIGQDNVFGFRSYQDFVNAQTNFVNNFNEENVRTIEVLLDQIVPRAEYLLEEEHMPVGSQLRGLFMSRDGKIIFV